jgi:hypothetical protein
MKKDSEKITLKGLQIFEASLSMITQKTSQLLLITTRTDLSIVLKPIKSKLYSLRVFLLADFTCSKQPYLSIP